MTAILFINTQLYFKLTLHYFHFVIATYYCFTTLITQFAIFVIVTQYLIDQYEFNFILVFHFKV